MSAFSRGPPRVMGNAARFAATMGGEASLASGISQVPSMNPYGFPGSQATQSNFGPYQPSAPPGFMTTNQQHSHYPSIQNTHNYPSMNAAPNFQPTPNSQYWNSGGFPTSQHGTDIFNRPNYGNPYTSNYPTPYVTLSPSNGPYSPYSGHPPPPLYPPATATQPAPSTSRGVLSSLGNYLASWVPGRGCPEDDPAWTRRRDREINRGEGNRLGSSEADIDEQTRLNTSNNKYGGSVGRPGNTNLRSVNDKWNRSHAGFHHNPYDQSFNPYSGVRYWGNEEFTIGHDAPRPHLHRSSGGNLIGGQFYTGNRQSRFHSGSTGPAPTGGPTPPYGYDPHSTFSQPFSHGPPPPRSMYGHSSAPYSSRSHFGPPPQPGPQAWSSMYGSHHPPFPTNTTTPSTVRALGRYNWVYENPNQYSNYPTATYSAPYDTMRHPPQTYAQSQYSGFNPFDALRQAAMSGQYSGASGLPTSAQSQQSHYAWTQQYPRYPQYPPNAPYGTHQSLSAAAPYSGASYDPYGNSAWGTNPYSRQWDPQRTHAEYSAIWSALPSDRRPVWGGEIVGVTNEEREKWTKHLREDPKAMEFNSVHSRALADPKIYHFVNDRATKPESEGGLGLRSIMYLDRGQFESAIRMAKQPFPNPREQKLDTIPTIRTADYTAGTGYTAEIPIDILAGARAGYRNPEYWSVNGIQLDPSKTDGTVYAMITEKDEDTRGNAYTRHKATFARLRPGGDATKSRDWTVYTKNDVKFGRNTRDSRGRSITTTLAPKYPIVEKDGTVIPPEIHTVNASKVTSIPTTT